MSTLPQGKPAALEATPTADQWRELIGLFDSERETFYRLAMGDLPTEERPELARLADLAQRVRSAVNESYEIESNNGSHDLVSYSGTRTPIPGELVVDVNQFLRAVDGKSTSDVAGKDYEGTEVSEVEMRFKLGEPDTSPAARDRLEARRTAKPFLLRVADEDLQHLAGQPPYVTHNLLHCARRTVLAPTAVFQGLRRGDGGPPTVETGWAICGKPRRTYHNDGTSQPTPEGMVYLVYADSEGYVFDWDWVQEDPDRPGYPLGPVDERFDREVENSPEFSFDIPIELRPGLLDRSQACYSSRGDCIFCYVSDRESFAVRINPDLTVFQQFDDRQQHTGFKIKNVQRILAVDQHLEVTDPPSLAVSVTSVLLHTLQRHPEGAVSVYDVLIEAIYRNGGQPPTVRVPRRRQADAECTAPL
jgi:hypothetical protein